MLARPLVRAASTSAVSASSSSSSSALSAYLLLSRPPTILRSPTPFESAYHAYNSKLQLALTQSFPRDLYFKKGSATETKFLEEEKARRAAARGEDLNKGEQSASNKSADQAEKAARAEESNESLYHTISTRTKADEQGRTDTLDRILDQHLFLMVKAPEMGNEWTLPFARVDKMGTETLHKAAPEAVHKLLGKNLDIWMVTNLPVAVVESKGEKGYVMRGHILSGQPSASEMSSKGIEFAWLTREEIHKRMSGEQWKDIQDLL
jgi:large subunit ribosomal protein L46